MKIRKIANRSSLFFLVLEVGHLFCAIAQNNTPGVVSEVGGGHSADVKFENERRQIGVLFGWSAPWAGIDFC